MIYGLTGGIATGKSTVSAMFRELGAVIIDADLISRQVVEPGTHGAERVREVFGEQFFSSDGKLKRDKLGAYVFHNEEARQKLNHLLHPLIRAEMKRQTEHAQKQNADFIIWDVPLLYESKLTHLVHKVIVVYVPENIQLMRLQQRNGLSEEDAKARIRAQLPIETKKSLADYLIDNSGTIQQTKRQVVALWNYLG
jgi:dephospho-CoA kinase